jgi:hypothetical protein
MNLSLMPDYIYQQFSAAGTPLSGGTVYFYQSETFTPKTVYADAAGTTPLGTSVTLSAAGTAVIFLDTGAYRIWIKDSMGSPVAPWVDGIVGGAATGATGTNATFGLYKVYNDVRALTGTPPDFVYVTGGTTEGDGGAGWFQLQPGSVLTEDGGILLTAASGSIVYRRVFDAVIDPQWYGVVYALNADQTYALNLALGASAAQNFPVLVTRSVYITSNISVPTGAMLETTLDGFFTAPGAVTMTFADGARFDGQGVTFGTNVQPLFGVGCCEAIRLSWMGGSVGDTRWVKFAASATAEYIAMADVSTSISSDPAVPANFALDFTEGAKITITALTNLTIGNLVYQGLGQIFQYNAIEYIGTISLPNTVSLLEWFGGISGGTPDNTIAFKAAAVSGSISLLPGRVYYIQDTGTPYVLPNALQIFGGDRTYLQINQRVGVTTLSLSALNLTGTGRLDASVLLQASGISALATNTLTGIDTSISDSNISCAVQSVNPATVTRSTVYNIDNVGICTDSTIQAAGKVSFGEGAVVSDSSIVKSHALDSTDQPFTQFNGTLLTFKNCKLDLNCPLHYSTSTTTTIKLIECLSTDNWVNAVSNGYSIIDWQNSIPVQNSSFTYMNGNSLLRQISLNPAISPCVATSELLTHWRGALGSSTQSGTQITIAADTVIDSSFASANTIRFYGTVLDTNDYAGQVNPAVLLVKRYGGIVVAKFDLPNASNLGFAPRLHVVQPTYLMDGVAIPGWLTAVDSANCQPYHWAPNNGSIILQANAWVGQRDVVQGSGDHHYTDQWGDVDLHYLNSRLEAINNLMLVITNEGTGNLPAGTKITLTIYPNLPDGIANYRAFFQLPIQANYIGSPDGAALLTHAQIYRNCDFAGLQVANSLNSNTPGAIPVTG